MTREQLRKAYEKRISIGDMRAIYAGKEVSIRIKGWKNDFLTVEAVGLPIWMEFSDEAVTKAVLGKTVLQLEA